jgi:hypothetical protein
MTAHPVTKNPTSSLSEPSILPVLESFHLPLKCATPSASNSASLMSSASSKVYRSRGIFSRGIETLNVLYKMSEICDGDDNECIPSVQPFGIICQPFNHVGLPDCQCLRSFIPTFGAHTTASNQISQTANGQSLTIPAVVSSNCTSEYARRTASRAGV